MSNDRIIGIPPDHVVHLDRVYAADTVPELWDLAMYQISKLHGMGIDGRGVKVAINDTGYVAHPNLPVPLASKSFISNESVTDANGHASWCSGRVLGRGGIGIAPMADLIIAKVLSNSGSGSTSGINQGRIWASEQGADIISESLGGPQPDQADIVSIEQCYTNGIALAVAAAGNAGYTGRNTIGYPGRYPNTYCIASHNQDGTISGFSSGGPEIHLATPGGNVISCSHQAARGILWATMSGTSMATPFFAGLMCLIIQKRRMLGYADIKGVKAWDAFFKQEGFFIDGGQPGFDPRFGNGMPSIIKIIEWLGGFKWV